MPNIAMVVARGMHTESTTIASSVLTSAWVSHGRAHCAAVNGNNHGVECRAFIDPFRLRNNATRQRQDTSLHLPSIYVPPPLLLPRHHQRCHPSRWNHPSTSRVVHERISSTPEPPSLRSRPSNVLLPSFLRHTAIDYYKKRYAKENGQNVSTLIKIHEFVANKYLINC